MPLCEAFEAIHDALVGSNDELQAVYPAEVLHTIGPKGYEPGPTRGWPHTLHVSLGLRERYVLSVWWEGARDWCDVCALTARVVGC